MNTDREKRALAGRFDPSFTVSAFADIDEEFDEAADSDDDGFCSHCNGSGMAQFGEGSCGLCHGRGR